ncbi:MAG: signal recognition particle-docking protein FtsY [Bacilli bacterium]
MGLLNFLKEKFSHRKDKETEKTEEPLKKEEAVKTEEKPKKEEPVPEKEIAIENKYVAGLDKSRVGFTDKLKKLAKANKVINADYFDSLERILIEADVGVSLSIELIKETSIEASANEITDPEKLNELLIDKMFVGYANKGGTFSTEISYASEGPTVVFMCGVNGGGKTTTVAKLANRYKNSGKKVLLVACDTFRAGAVEQLDFWAQKVGVDLLTRPNSDPASLCYDALKKAKDENYDMVIVDTAGRLQNKKSLMDELSKMVRVMKKVIPEAPHETLLVIDANTGQNGIDQAKVFKEVAAISGIVITKMDGTSKGGIILSIRDQLALPVKFIGLGEKMDDLEEFDLDKYLYGLLIGDEKE